jgi:Arginine/lysine/ornithine decarboxylases
MHMPGHKRNTELMQMGNPYDIDITEIEGFDNLHQPEGVLKELSNRISQLYGSKCSYPLVNGSTAGILAGISAATKYGDKVIVARNCHKSVYHAITVKGLVPIYLYPPQVENMPVNGGILPSEIEDALIKHKDVALVILTSPTYEGIVSDINEISEVVHRYGALLFVDEAHGAHFGFHEEFPLSAVSQGADIVIQSLHKTLPSFTQTAVLHSNSERLNKRIQQYLSIYQSSSPSYILLAGIDRCISILEDRKEELFQEYNRLLSEFYLKIKDLKHLRVFEPNLVGQYGIHDLDRSKIVISVHNTNLTGHQLHSLLYHDYHITLEMETPDYVLAMTSIGDKEEGFQRLAEALITIDQSITVPTNQINTSSNLDFSLRPICSVLPAKAVEMQSEQIPVKDSIGRICAAYISMYPPGTPILVPGEIIEEEAIQYIQFIRRNKITITGLCEANNEIEVLCEDRE